MAFQPKRVHRGSNYTLYRTPGATRLCIMVPGLGNTDVETYWGHIPDLLRYEADLNDIDICFWMYPSRRTPFPNFASVLRRGRRVSTIPELASANLTCLDELINNHGYSEIKVAGHSLGGLIGIASAEREIELKPDHRIFSIFLLSTPKRPPLLAKLAALLGWRNPHILWLASGKVGRAMRVSVQNLRRAGRRIEYVHCSNDELLPWIEEIDFDAHHTILATHSWPAQVRSRSSPGYQTLLAWLLLD